MKAATQMSANRPAPTLRDVAKRAGVSAATVSRCLNTPKQVSEAARAQVMEAVEAIGYTPNFGARAMATQRTQTIGVLIPSLEDSGIARTLQALETTLAARGYGVMLATSLNRPELEGQQIHSLRARGIDALLLHQSPSDPEVDRFLTAQNIPILLLRDTGAAPASADTSSNPRPAIGIDTRKAMGALGEEVLRLGHRQIAMISTDPATDPQAAACQDGLRRAIQDAGLPISALQIITTNQGLRQGAGAFARLMEATPRPSAVLCTHDTLAIGALNRARAMGLRVPDEVSITGFGDLDGAQMTAPKLASVHVPHEQIGRKAARALLAALEDGVPPTSEEVAVKLRLRASLGPVAKRR